MNQETAYPRRGASWYMVAVLMTATFTALLDRYLPAIMIEPMRGDLRLSDTQLSLVQGLAFSLFYCVAGIPLGRLVDRRSRRNLLVAGVLAWTGLTIWSGLASSYTELFVARAGVGIAEAALAPAAFSMIADCFPPELRGRALSVYFSSLNVGTSMSFILGGMLFQHLSQVPTTLPLLGAIAPWRATFVLMALLGLPAALLLFTVREPDRRAGMTPTEPVQLFAFLRGNAAGMALLYATFGLLAFISVIGVTWASTFYLRSFGIPVGQTGVWLGIMMLVGGVIGPLCGGWLSDRLAQRPGAGRMWIPVVAIATAAPLLVGWPLVPSITLGLGLFFLATTMLTFGTSSSGAVIQDVVPNSLRGQTIAINQIVMLLTSGLAPTAVALSTDRLFRDPGALYLSIALVSAVFGLIGVVVGKAALAGYADLRAGSPRGSDRDAVREKQGPS